MGKKQAVVTFQYDEEVKREDIQKELEGLTLGNGLEVISVNVDGKGTGADINLDAQDGHYNFNLDGPAEHLKDNNSTYDWKEDANTNLEDDPAFNGEGDHARVAFGEEAVELAEQANEDRKENSEEVEKVEGLSKKGEEDKKNEGFKKNEEPKNTDKKKFNK